MKITKMQGCGNDFILIDDREEGGRGRERVAEEKKAEVAEFLCRRRFSVGADGVLFLCDSATAAADVRMRVFNADGSEAEMCGNGLRCFAKYAYEKGAVPDRRGGGLRVETLAGVVVAEVLVGSGLVRVFMGKPRFERVDEPFFVNERVGVVRLTSLRLGNPHAVVVVDSFEGLDLDAVGRGIESHEAFPERTNVDFVVVEEVGRGREEEKEVSVRTYERGVGETLSCGTGATASVLALNELGRVAAAAGATAVTSGEPVPVTVQVHTRGGDLEVELWEEGAYLVGPAEKVFEGVVELR
ncbi:MAG: diaminopimelate epimerase [Candidatus Methanophagaceae archaeon]|nr:MAG: diaminopimelate epimerase [Methanophagales archaeon]